MLKATRVKKGLLIKAYFLETFETKLYSKMFALILLKTRLQTDLFFTCKDTCGCWGSTGFCEKLSTLAATVKPESWTTDIMTFDCEVI